MELLVQGRRAYAYTGGKPFDAALPCVVFIHGALHDHSVWTLLARWFAHHGRAVLAVDQPGHGRSDGPLLGSVEAVADWTLALLDAAGADSVSTTPRAGAGQTALVGHSMGSLVALEAASRAPERVSHLVMMATAFPMPVSAALLTAARDAPDDGMDMVNQFSFSSTAAKPGYPGPGAWQHGANRQLMARMQAGHPEANVFEHDFRLCNAYANGLQAAALVGCPTHLLLGAADQMTPPKASHDIATALKARVTTLAGGHALMQEQPEASLAALRAALG